MNTCRHCTHYLGAGRCAEFYSTKPDQPAAECPRFELPTDAPGTCPGCRHWPGRDVACDAAHRHATGSVRSCTWWRPRRYLFEVQSANVVASNAPATERVGGERVPLARCRRQTAQERHH